MTRANWCQYLWGLRIRTSVRVLESLLVNWLIGTCLLVSGPVVLPSPLAEALDILSWPGLTACPMPQALGVQALNLVSWS